MKIWTVVYAQELDVMPFKYSYNSHDAAMRAVEDNAKEDFIAMYQPWDNVKFEGVEWNDDKTTAFIDADDEAAGYWVIQETELVE
jgi:hypothetical protein